MPDQALERTAARRTFAFQMIKAVSLEADRAVGGGRSSLLSLGGCGHVLKSTLKRLPGAGWLRGGWPDEARHIIQSAALRHVLDGQRLEGDCLNAGCGEGLYAPFLDGFPDLRRIVHIDLEKGRIADRFPNRRHEDFGGSVTELPFAPAEFNVCLCTEVMEHLEDDDRGFAELARVLKPNALLLISTPTPTAPFDPNHVREGYTYEEMRDHLEGHGFELLNHTFCFHWVMRSLLVVWRWQFETFGGTRRSLMPRFLVHLAGVLDRSFPIGQPCDIVVLARRRPPTPTNQ
jgi:SAM-dependent methyltransferase